MDENIGESTTTNPVPAHERTSEEWNELKAAKTAEKRGKKAALYEALFKAYYSHQPTAEIAKNAMATQLLKDINPKIKSKFEYVAGGAKNPAAAWDTLFQADEHIDDLVLKIIEKLDDGKFETSAKLQTYVGTMMGLAIGQAVGILNKHQNTYVPLSTTRKDENGDAYEDDDEVTNDDAAKVNGNGESLVWNPLDREKMKLLEDSEKVNQFLDTYKACQMDIKKTADVLGITKSNAGTQLSRIKDKLQFKELETVLQHQFGFTENIQEAVADILPCVEKMMQRTAIEYPKTWEQAQALELKPKVRRVEEDRVKTSWMGAVRHLVKLWKEKTACSEEDSIVIPLICASAALEGEIEGNIVSYIRCRRSAWTADELGNLLSMSRKHIYKLAKAGRMPSYRVGGSIRFDPRATADWLEERMVA